MSTGFAAPLVGLETVGAPLPGPPVPDTLRQAELDPAHVADLVLKILYRSGARSGARLSESTRLAFTILDDLLLGLQHQHLIEVRRAEGNTRSGYVFDLTTEGRTRAREAMLQSRYVGPAPVTFSSYVDWISRQSVSGRHVTPGRIRDVLSHLVLDESFIDAVGAAANSGTALFLYGSPGNGKTAVARALARVFDESIFVPYAIVVDGGTIVQLYDPVCHEDSSAPRAPADAGSGLFRPPHTFDPRFARIRRPAVTVGGELTADQLELQHDAQSGAYRAPLQMKANGGVLVIDDFGRQRIPSRDLLNRWMIPLEEHIDYVSLPTGHKLPVPFDCFLVFSTNLQPTELAEEAFLRRLRYKVAVTDPTREQYATILRRCCDESGIDYCDAALDPVFRRYYKAGGIRPRACHPRDLLAHVRDEAAYRGVDPYLTPASMEQACRAYFLESLAAGTPTTAEAAHHRSD